MSENLRTFNRNMREAIGTRPVVKNERFFRVFLLTDNPAKMADLFIGSPDFLNAKKRSQKKLSVDVEAPSKELAKQKVEAFLMEKHA